MVFAVPERWLRWLTESATVSARAVVATALVETPVGVVFIRTKAKNDFYDRAFGNEPPVNGVRRWLVNSSAKKYTEESKPEPNA